MVDHESYLVWKRYLLLYPYVERMKLQSCFLASSSGATPFCHKTAYAACQNSADIIVVQNEWLSQKTQVPTAMHNAEEIERSAEEEANDSRDSDDGLPPLEKNMNHLLLQDRDEDFK